MPESQYARTSDGVRIRFFRLGDGPALVFASNAFGDAHLYHSLHPHTRRMTDRLVELGWSVVRYDLRGAGESDRTVSDLTLDSFVLDLEAVIAELGLKRFALAGLHAGAATAVAYAAGHPVSVASLVLLNPFRVGSYPFEVDPVGRAIASVSSLATDNFAFFSLVAGNLMTRFDNPEHARQLARVFEQSTSPQTHVAYLEALKAIDLNDRLSQLAMPVLVVHDTGFPFGSFEEREGVASAIGHARLTVIAGDGEAEIAEINSFLRNPAPEAVFSAANVKLTGREIEVLGMLAQGKTNQDIAEFLVLSERTVARHVTNIYSKLDVHTRAEATRYAVLRGLA
jgi:pimeloyl-ACP methyl ester carboxylesterase